MSQPVYLYGPHVAKILLSDDIHRSSILNLKISDYYKDKNNNKNITEIVNLANKYKISLKFMPKNKLEQIAGSNNHQGIIVECHHKIFQAKQDGDLKVFIDQLIQTQNKSLILILDGIQDPHNLGACIRSAEALGASCVIIPKNNSAGINNTVYKVSSGAALYLPVFQVTNLARVIEYLKEQGIWIYGAHMRAEHSIRELDFTDHKAIIMGSEGSGMRKLTEKLCDYFFTIPMQGKTESLNVSVATAISLYEAGK